MNKVLLSSVRMDWGTPQEFYNELNTEFSFTLDPCASHENAKCEKYYTTNDDGLAQSWRGERVFCNPPYGRVIGKWVKKCAESDADVVVMLIPARTDTRWFHDYIYGSAEIRFIRGRLKFTNKSIADFTGNSKTSPAPFPSMVVVFRRP